MTSFDNENNLFSNSFENVVGTNFKYIPIILKETIQAEKVPATDNISYDAKIEVITAMKQYENMSLEELRHEDYNLGYKEAILKNRNIHSETYITNSEYQNVIGTPIKFCSVPELQYPRKKQITVQEIDVRIEAITAMKKYESKSFEELHLEDYQNGYNKNDLYRSPVSLGLRNSCEESSPFSDYFDNNCGVNKIIKSISNKPFANFSLLKQSSSPPPDDSNKMENLTHDCLMTDITTYNPSLSSSPKKPLYVLFPGSSPKTKPIVINKNSRDNVDNSSYLNKMMLDRIQNNNDVDTEDGEDNPKCRSFPNLKVFKKLKDNNVLEDMSRSSSEVISRNSAAPITSSISRKSIP